MTHKEYMLTGDINSWLLYAMNTLGLEENEAILMWNNKNNVGKKVICECKGEENDKQGTRLFIRNVTNILEDAYTKEGWWNTFTLSKERVKKGLWLAEIVNYRLDRNGYLNSEVKVIMPVNDIAFHALFSERKGTWNSSAWWLMMVASEAFLREYNFSTYEIIHEPNFDELKRRFPIFDGLSAKEIGEKALYMYLNNEVTIEEIEECLDTPNDLEKLISNVTIAVLRGNVEKLYGDKYPLFAKKVSHNVKNGYFDSKKLNTKDYIERQIWYYNELLQNKKIEPIIGDTLDIVESALAYRKSLNDAEKAERKKRRKKNK